MAEKNTFVPQIDYTPFHVYEVPQRRIDGYIQTYFNWLNEIRDPNYAISPQPVGQCYMGIDGVWTNAFSPYMNFNTVNFDDYELFGTGVAPNYETISENRLVHLLSIEQVVFEEKPSASRIARVINLPAQIPEAYPFPHMGIVDIGTVEEMQAKYGGKWVAYDTAYYNDTGLPRSEQPQTGFEITPIKRYAFDTVFNLHGIGVPEEVFGDGDVLIPFQTYYMSDKTEPFGNTFTTQSLYGTIQNDVNAVMFVNIPDALSVNIGDAIQLKQAAPGYYLTFPSREYIVDILNDVAIPWTTSQDEAINKDISEFEEFDPNTTGQGENETGGGDGDGDNSSDDVSGVAPGVSTLNSLNAQYAMTPSRIQAFAEYIWTTKWYENLDLVFNDPSQGIISCQLFPFNIQAHDPSGVGASQAIVVGNVEIPEAFGSPILSTYNQRFDLGSYKINEYFGSFLDYSPYTSINIHLPYIGIKQLDTNEVMNETIRVEYIVDVATGSCIANIWTPGKLLYEFNGNIGINVPISSTNAATQSGNDALAKVGAVAGVATAAFTGGVGAAVGIGIATSSLGKIAGNKLQVNKGGVSAPQCAHYNPQYAYLIIERPIQSLPQNYGGFKGRPSNTTQLLNDCKGYFEVDTMILDNVVCSENEKDMLLSELQKGVILR